MRGMSVPNLGVHANGEAAGLHLECINWRGIQRGLGTPMKGAQEEVI